MPMVNTGIGVSQKDNLIEAAREAALKAKEELNGKTPKLLMFFCIYTYPKEQYEEAQKEIYQVFENDKIPLVGATTAGFFAKDKYYFDPNLLGKNIGSFIETAGRILPVFRMKGAMVVALESKYLNIGVGISEKFLSDPKIAGAEAIKMALDNLEYNPAMANLALGQEKEGLDKFTSFKPVDGFIISPGVNNNGILADDIVLEGVREETRGNVRIAGGGMCGGVEATGMPVAGNTFYNGKSYKQTLISVVLGTDLNIGYGTATGMEPLGDTVVITKVEGLNVVKEINNKPALEVLGEIVEKHTGIKKEDFAKAPLSLAVKGYSFNFTKPRENFYWPVIFTTAQENSLITSVRAQEGMGLTLAKITKESCKKANQDSAQLMIEDAKSKDFGLIMFFSCCLRGEVLQTQYFKEIEGIKKAVGNSDVPVIGLVSMGEQAFYKNSPLTGTQLTITMFGISNKLLSEE